MCTIVYCRIALMLTYLHFHFGQHSVRRKVWVQVGSDGGRGHTRLLFLTSPPPTHSSRVQGSVCHTSPTLRVAPSSSTHFLQHTRVISSLICPITCHSCIKNRLIQMESELHKLHFSFMSLATCSRLSSQPMQLITKEELNLTFT